MKWRVFFFGLLGLVVGASAEAQTLSSKNIGFAPLPLSNNSLVYLSVPGPNGYVSEKAYLSSILASGDVTVVSSGGTTGDIPAWNAPSQLSSGIPYGQYGNSTLLETSAAGRFYFGLALAGQSPTCGSGSWIEQVIPSTACISSMFSTSEAGTPYAGGFAVRTSDNPTGSYGFALGVYGINDAAGSFPLETLYNETHAYTSSQDTLAEESDILNMYIPNTSVPKIYPYSMTPSGPILVDKWLSNGRPDVLVLYFSQTFTAGDVVSFTFTGGYTGSPQTVSATVAAGDTNQTFSVKIAAAISANTTLNKVLYPYAVLGGVSILGAPLPSAMTVTQSASGAGTEDPGHSYGGNTSAVIGILNNSNGTSGVGSAYSGIAFGCSAIANADCTNTGGVGEAMALSRGQAIDFYNSGDSAQSPAARIYSATTSSVPTLENIRFDNSGLVIENTADGGFQFSVAPLASATDYLTVYPGTVSSAAALGLASSRTNAGFNLVTHGSGTLGIYIGSTLDGVFNSNGFASPGSIAAGGAAQQLDAFTVPNGYGYDSFTTASTIVPLIYMNTSNQIEIGNGTTVILPDGTLNLADVSGGGTATKYVCVDASGNVVVQTAAC